MIPSILAHEILGEQEEDPNALTTNVTTVIDQFIRNSYLTTWFDDPTNIRRQFADPLEDYWGTKDVPLRNVVAEKLEYYRKWPRRSYHLVEGSLRINPAAGRADVYAARFQYQFSAENARSRSSGVGETELTLKLLRQNEIVILSENGRVLRRD